MALLNELINLRKQAGLVCSTAIGAHFQTACLAEREEIPPIRVCTGCASL